MADASPIQPANWPVRADWRPQTPNMLLCSLWIDPSEQQLKNVLQTPLLKSKRRILKKILSSYSFFISWFTTRNGVRVSNKTCASVRQNRSWRASYEFLKILSSFRFLEFSTQENGAGSLWIGASKSNTWRTSYVKYWTSCSPPLFLASQTENWCTCCAPKQQVNIVLVEILNLNLLLLLSTVCVQILIQTKQIGGAWLKFGAESDAGEWQNSRTAAGERQFRCVRITCLRRGKRTKENCWCWVQGAMA